MTREEAIAYWTLRSKHIHDWLKHNEDAWFVAEYVEAIDMAIEALTSQNLTEPNNSWGERREP